MGSRTKSTTDQEYESNESIAECLMQEGYFTLTKKGVFLLTESMLGVDEGFTFSDDGFQVLYAVMDRERWRTRTFGVFYSQERAEKTIMPA